MSQQDVQKIKDRLGIEEVVGSYITLTKSGSNFKARCPFHNEKTPSFFVSPDRSSYYCFGCGAKGDIFSFIQQFEGLDFVGALKVLADRAGVVLTNDFSEKDSHSILYKIMEEATKFFEKNLTENAEALTYLKKRGLEVKTIKDWRLGFAKDGWKNLFEHLLNKKFSQKDIELAGLIKKGDRGDYYDRFRSRIIFPIFDASGRPVAFTGRIFGEESKDVAKYLNSPETSLFDKSRILYGFHVAKKVIRKLNFSILVEGQMDLILAHQTGYTNTIASSGTALTEHQLNILNRFSNRIVIAYDADNAGFNASERAWQIALSLGMDIKLADIKSGDPADLILQDRNLWKEAIKNSKNIIEKILEKIESGIKDKRDQIKAIAKNLVPYLAKIQSNIEQAHFIQIIAQKFEITESALRQDIQNYLKNNSTEEVVMAEIKKNKSEMEMVKKRLIGLLLWLESKNKSEKDNLRTKLEDLLGKEIICDLITIIDSEKDALLFEIENLYQNSKNLDSDIERLISNLKVKELIEKRNQLKIELADAEKNGQEENVNQIFNQINHLSKEINSLSREKV